MPNCLFPKQFATVRLSLAPPVKADRETIFNQWASDPAVTRFVAWPTAQTSEDLNGFLARAERGWAEGSEFTWLIAEKSSHETIGAVSVRIQGHKAELGYVLRARSWNNGYMTEILRAIAPRCLAIPSIFRISAVCDVENIASARVMEKAGLSREGILRAWTRHPQAGPQPRDCWSYSLSRHA